VDSPHADRAIRFPGPDFERLLQQRAGPFEAHDACAWTEPVLAFVVDRPFRSATAIVDGVRVQRPYR
jgi:hypothetical protein